ncbi:hypothetical protein V8D89_006913 [Ganoderma adspersum]
MQTTKIWRLRSLPDLNFDILLQIISLLTPRDIAHLTRTCHALRRALSAELPREGVTLEGRHLTSFLEFSNVKHGRDRLTYFQELVLPGSTYGTSMSSGDQALSLKDVKRALSTILPVASNLKSLTVLDMEAFSFSYKELKTILDSLPHLRELEMSGIQKKHQGVLADVLPRLRTLDLDFLEESDASAFLKSRKIDSLQDVVLNNAVFKDTTITFPTVHTLRACPANFPRDIDALTRVFPNVRDVVFDFPRDYGSLDPEYLKGMGGQTRGHMRYFGIEWSDPTTTAVQAVRARLLTRPKKTWPHIQSLRAAGTGCGMLLWVGLTCEVPRVEVCSWRMKTSQLACVLNELRARCLVLHRGTHHGFSTSTPEGGWGLLLALRHAPTVTRLAVVLCRPSLRYFSNANWLTFCVYLGTSSVSCFLVRLAFDCPIGKELFDQIETWREEMAKKILSLRVFLCQVEDRVPLLGWVKKEHPEKGWKEMPEDEARKLVASEKICPEVVEPCELCRRCASNIFAFMGSNLYCIQRTGSTQSATVAANVLYAALGTIIRPTIHPLSSRPVRSALYM